MHAVRGAILGQGGGNKLLIWVTGCALFQGLEVTWLESSFLSESGASGNNPIVRLIARTKKEVGLAIHFV
jgi:hypothetical protein